MLNEACNQRRLLSAMILLKRELDLASSTVESVMITSHENSTIEAMEILSRRFEFERSLINSILRVIPEERLITIASLK